MKDTRKLWDRYATIYDFEVAQFSKQAYENIYENIKGVVNKEMEVLELATGTGLIALEVAPFVKRIEATDNSAGMIKKAQKKNSPENLQFSIAAAEKLPFESNQFDVVIISNALHLIQELEVVMTNIKRVLKPGGILIAPNFTHGHLKQKENGIVNQLLRRAGFETYNSWLPDEYIYFIEESGFKIQKTQQMKAAFPLVYVEAINS